MKLGGAQGMPSAGRARRSHFRVRCLVSVFCFPPFPFDFGLSYGNMVAFRILMDRDEMHDLSMSCLHVHRPTTIVQPDFGMLGTPVDGDASDSDSVHV